MYDKIHHKISNVYTFFKCDICNRKHKRRLFDIKNGKSKPCSCWRPTLKGKRFGALTAIDFVNRKDFQVFWLFKCDCGKDCVFDSRLVSDFKLLGCCEKCQKPYGGKCSGGKSVARVNKFSFYDFKLAIRVSGFMSIKKYFQVKNKQNIKLTFKSIIRTKLKSFFRKSKIEVTKTMLDNFLDTVLTKIRSNPKCYITGRPINLMDSSSYHFDHILPRSRGGDNSVENLGLTCAIANRSKSNMTIEEYIELCKEVLINHGYEINKRSND